MDKIDLHMHTTVSDGTDSPSEIVKKVKDAGIKIFSVTDHDSIKTAGIIKGMLSENDPVFFSGVEFTCKDQKGEYHILGYGYDANSKAICTVAEKGHNLRVNKVRALIKAIDEKYGITFPDNEIDMLYSLDNPGKLHIGNLCVKYGYAKTKEQAMYDYLININVQTDFISLKEAVGAIIESGGVVVLAHPFFGNGGQLLNFDEMDDRLKHLTYFGLQGVEAFYSGFSKKQIDEMLGFADKYNLYVTAGSDYHGTNRTVKLGDTGIDKSEIPYRLNDFILKMSENL